MNMSRKISASTLARSAELGFDSWQR